LLLSARLGFAVWQTTYIKKLKRCRGPDAR
jgi:hypothetical protein